MERFGLWARLSAVDTEKVDDCAEVSGLPAVVRLDPMLNAHPLCIGGPMLSRLAEALRGPLAHALERGADDLAARLQLVRDDPSRPGRTNLSLSFGRAPSADCLAFRLDTRP